MRVLPSLRLWLLSTGTLSVIAGYVLLLGVHALLARQQRLQSHQQLVMAVAEQRSSFELNGDMLAPFGVEVAMLPNGKAQAPRLEYAIDGVLQPGGLRFPVGQHRHFNPEWSQHVSIQFER